MSRVVHFEITSKDVQQTIEFYQKVFGWEIKKWDGPVEYWLVMTGPEDEPGIDGGIMVTEDQPPGTVNTVEVDSLDEYIQKVEANGGQVIVPKVAVPGVGYMVYCQDTQGVTFGLMEMDESAQ